MTMAFQDEQLDLCPRFPLAVSLMTMGTLLPQSEREQAFGSSLLRLNIAAIWKGCLYLFYVVGVRSGTNQRN